MNLKSVLMCFASVLAMLGLGDVLGIGGLLSYWLMGIFHEFADYIAFIFVATIILGIVGVRIGLFDKLAGVMK